MDHLALVTDLFYRCSNFHYNSNSICCLRVQNTPPLRSLRSFAGLKPGTYITVPRLLAGRASIRLLVAVDDSAAGQVVRREFYCYLISGENPDEVLAHLAGNVREDLVLVLQLDAEHRVWQRLDDRG